MDYKEINRIVYNKYATKFEEKTKDFIPFIIDDMELFIQKLSGKKILDLGSGPGRDALFFKGKGLFPVCIDNSEVMIGLCKKKGLNAQMMDIENLQFEKNSFDGIWAYTSLLHVPKQNFSAILEKIASILKERCIFCIGMKEGNFEGFLESEKYPDGKRFFSLYKDDELREKLSKYFDILHASKVSLRNATFLNYLCKKK